MSRYQVEQLPDIDQREIKRGRCPWCLKPLHPDLADKPVGDSCSNCGDEFVGKITIED